MPTRADIGNSLATDKWRGTAAWYCWPFGTRLLAAAPPPFRHGFRNTETLIDQIRRAGLHVCDHRRRLCGLVSAASRGNRDFFCAGINRLLTGCLVCLSCRPV